MIKIYTDGSCIQNPGNGGWAAIMLINNEKKAMAAIEALKKIPIGEEVQIYTDSKYVKMGITEWIEKWLQNNWKTSSKKKVKNLELWKELSSISKKHKIKWLWIKGHAGDPINEEVDALAKKAAKSS